LVVFLITQFSSTPPQKGVFKLVVGKRYSVVLVVMLFLSGMIWMVTPATAIGTSHTISVTIQEISRYRVENVVKVGSSEKEPVYDISLAVFSNSQRQWNLTAQPEVYDNKLEWSTDGRNWKNISPGLNTLVSGTRVNWAKYHVYYRYRKTNEVPSNPFAIQYQLSYQE
jgi:hypothetical protein